MGKMQCALKSILGEAGVVSHQRLPVPSTVDVVRAGIEKVIDYVYRKLDGVLPEAELNLRHWDMEFEGVAVELDEYLHFNRYRAATLDSPAYAGLSSFPMDIYRRYCAKYEAQCLSAGGYGGKWSNKSCERQFGPCSSPKHFEGGGAPRWKQRAFYDFIKDLSPLLVDIRVVRIAVWDKVPDGADERTVADVLLRPSASAARSLVELIRKRGA